MITGAGPYFVQGWFWAVALDSPFSAFFLIVDEKRAHLVYYLS